jgi:hypothetical protein
MPEIKEHELPVAGHLHSNGDFCAEAAATDGSQGWPVDLTSHQAATEAIKELKGRLEEAERDAARYRWLRATDRSATALNSTYPQSAWENHVWLMQGEQLDAAIDRALSLEGGGET